MCGDWADGAAAAWARVAAVAASVNGAYLWSMTNSGGRSCVMLRVAPKTLVQGTFLNARPADFANASASRRRPPARYESVRSRRLAQATGASTAASAPVSTSRDPTALLDVPCPARAEKRRQAAHGQ